MAAVLASIDLTADMELPTSSLPGAQRTLLLAPPSIAAHEERLRDLFTTFDRSTTDLQMLDRLSSGFAVLPAATYDLVLLLTDVHDGKQTLPQEWLTRKVYAALLPSMKIGGAIRAQDGFLNSSEAREAILAGLVESDGAYRKVEEEEVVVPLRLGKKNGLGQKVQINLLDDLDGFDDDDELVDEDTLLTDMDLKNLPQPPPECAPNGGKRRRACKDCTCGLAERLQQQQDKANKDLNILKLKAEELNELDFTVKGKTGSCNSCSLGDAFRCAGCPFIGFPAFKPGEEVMLLKNTPQF